ncbi:hypothetical protein [Nocardia sp. NPDC020380]|uniref:hypothetical protein n=1 Tax=Nocardia sp. NPDC020380 TaxID=3364309 RepID=UPI0037B1EF52
MLDGRPVEYVIPEGNGNNTVDLRIRNPDGTFDVWRVARGANGALVHWHNDADGNASYASRPDAASEWNINSFAPGTSTSGTPTVELGATADLSGINSPSYDAAGNLVGYDNGVLNQFGFYDNHHFDNYGNQTISQAKPDGRGGIESAFIGQIGPDHHGWMLDSNGRPGEYYLDGNDKPVIVSHDPVTGRRRVEFDGGANTFDSNGNWIDSQSYGADGRLLSSWSREGQTDISSWRDSTDHLRTEFHDAATGKRGTLEELPNGTGTRIKFADGAELELGRDGAVISSKGPKDTRVLADKIAAGGINFVKGLGKGALGMVEGVGALTGINRQINVNAALLGYHPNLPNEADAALGLVKGVASIYKADFKTVLTAGLSIGHVLGGSEGWGTAWTDIRRSMGNSLNERSKLLIGTDWTGFSEHPAETLGEATFGVGSFFLPTKGAGTAVKGGGTTAKIGGAAIHDTVTAAKNAAESAAITAASEAAKASSGMAPAIAQSARRAAATNARTMSSPTQPIRGAGAALRGQIPPTVDRRAASATRARTSAGEANITGIINIDAAIKRIFRDSMGEPNTAIVGVPADLASGILARQLDGAPRWISSKFDATSPRPAGAVGGARRGTPTSPSARQMQLKDKSLNTKDGVAPSRDPIPTMNSDGSYTIRLERKDHWSKTDFRRKVEVLQRASDGGALFKKSDSVSTRSGSAQRARRREMQRSIRNDHRDQLSEIDRRYARGAINQAERVKLQAEADALRVRRLDRLKTKEMDHFHELQLNGLDEVGNLGPLENITNHGMGQQIRNQLVNVPDGAMVRIEVLRW